MLKAQRNNDLWSLRNAAGCLGGVVSPLDPLQYMCSTIEGVQYQITKLGRGMLVVVFIWENDLLLLIPLTLIRVLPLAVNI